MNEIALIFIYNHQYNQNIEILESIYSKRFKNIFHLVPFYLGEKENVIAVYENSFYFQGYIAQGYKTFFNEKYSHYVFIADDLFLHVDINEENIRDHFRLSDISCFIPDLINLSDFESPWNWMENACNFKVKTRGIEIDKQLPSVEEAQKCFHRFGLNSNPVNHFKVYPRKKMAKCRSLHDLIEYSRYKLMALKNGTKDIVIEYPLVSSYSDLCIVSRNSIRQFCHYCGLFASASLFVEVGLPTALVLCAQHIVQEKELQMQGTGLWNEEDWILVEKYRSNLNSLLGDFPKKLYIHPIKISQWTR